MLSVFLLFWSWSFSRLSWRHWFDSDRASCSGGKLVWTFRSFVVWVVAWYYLSVIHLGIPNRWVPTTFQDVIQSACMCFSPNAPDWLVSSGGEAFWHIWNVQWLPERQLRMHFLLVSEARLENHLSSGWLDWRPVAKICVLLYPLTGVSRNFYGTQSKVLATSLCWG